MESGNEQQLIEEAHNGDHEAKYKLGIRYFLGNDVEEDVEKALYWTEKAATGGHAKAMVNCYHHFINGIGVEKNTKSALLWTMAAAVKGDAKGQYNYATMLDSGEGVPQNPRRAMR